jgi:hypothetical protein
MTCKELLTIIERKNSHHSILELYDKRINPVNSKRTFVAAQLRDEVNNIFTEVLKENVKVNSNTLHCVIDTLRGKYGK